MQITNFNFSEIDSRDSFKSLAASLGGKAIDNTIQIPSDHGSGSIRKIDFEKGLHLRAWNFNLNQAFTFVRGSHAESEPGKAFSLIYILSPDSVIVEGRSEQEFRFNPAMNLLLVSNKTNVNFLIRAKTPVKALDITINMDWVMQEFNDSQSCLLLFQERLKAAIKPVLRAESGTSPEYRTALDLLAHASSGDKGALYLKAKTLSLISDFFTREFSIQPVENTENGHLHHDKMLMVEQLLEDHFEKDLPSIEDIARTAALSESTLKRHFKVMFGKSIYEFYLEKKMDYAKRLLLEKPLTVKEVAYRLGYEKTSNFIHIFKKFHHYSPGTLKKNIAF
jgi:AraC-like DNA-binding protein